MRARVRCAFAPLYFCAFPSLYFCDILCMYGDQLRGDWRRSAAAAAAAAASSSIACAWKSLGCRRQSAAEKIVWFSTRRVPQAANRIIMSYRGHCARGVMGELVRRKRMKAAGVLQCCWRCRCARQRRQYLWKVREGIIADESARIVQKVALHCVLLIFLSSSSS